MTICGNREFALLKKIGFVRVSGSQEEKKAAQIFKVLVLREKKKPLR